MICLEKRAFFNGIFGSVLYQNILFRNAKINQVFGDEIGLHKIIPH